MKKFERLGRSLSVTEQKLILGGEDEIEVPGEGSFWGCNCTCPSGKIINCDYCGGSYCFNKVYYGCNQEPATCTNH